MKLNFFGFDPSYHVARYHFVCKVPRSRTPLYLARHRPGAVAGREPAGSPYAADRQRRGTGAHPEARPSPVSTGHPVAR